MKSDLHCHSECSDGSLRVEDILYYAKRIGLDYIALTDHDTLYGSKIALSLQGRFGIGVIPGVEISTRDYQRNRPVHMICYFPKDMDKLQSFLNQTLTSRASTKLQMIEKIMSIYPVTFEHIQRYSKKSQSIYECHIMQALADLGYTNVAIGPLMKQLISSKGSCYVPNCYPDVHEALGIIKQVGGIAVMAHPGQFDSLELLEELAAAHTVQGVELNHPRNNEETRGKIETIALKYNLITTGGTDFHGEYAEKPYPLGSFPSPDQAVISLLEIAKKQN